MDEQHHEHGRVEHFTERCPAGCGLPMYAQESERGGVCEQCSLALDRELVAYLGYVEQVRAIRTTRDE